MKIGIFGMGAVGCSIYEELQEYKELYILVDEERLDKYKNGFIINDVLYHPNLKTNIIVDLLILCVKNYQLKVALADMQRFVDDKTIILPLLNGITAHDEIASYYPNNNVLYGVINVEANKIGNKVVKGRIINLQFGEKNNLIVKDYLLQIDQIFSKYNLKHHIYENMIKRVWLKWMLNMGINQVSAAGNLTYRQMRHPLIFELLCTIFKEVYEVSKAYDIGLSESDLEETINRCQKFDSDRVTSLTIDFNNGHENELDSFSKTLIELAERKNIATPVNKALYCLLKGKFETTNK